MWIHLRVFFLSFLAVFTTENSRDFSCFCDLPQCSPLCTYTVSENSSAQRFRGRRVCADVVYFGGWVEMGVGVQISEGGMRWNPSILGFYNRKLQLAEGTGEWGQIKKYMSSFLLKYHQLREHSAGGDVCQGLLIQCVPPVLFLNPSADFIPGML